MLMHEDWIFSSFEEDGFKLIDFLNNLGVIDK